MKRGFERTGTTKIAGLRALDEAEKGRIKYRYIVCRTKAIVRLSDGAWVLNVSELLKKL